MRLRKHGIFREAILFVLQSTVRRGRNRRAGFNSVSDGERQPILVPFTLDPDSHLPCDQQYASDQRAQARDPRWQCKTEKHGQSDDDEVNGEEDMGDHGSIGVVGY